MIHLQGDFGAYSVLESAELYDWDQNSWTATGKHFLPGLTYNTIISTGIHMTVCVLKRIV